MRNVIITAVSLENFRGIKKLEVGGLHSGVVEVRGRNATGKSTVGDAIVWCLFGKDLEDRKSINIKTKDEAGNDIPRLTHSVTINLAIDGEPHSVTRTLSEKWQKKKGEIEATFVGNEEKMSLDGVPLTATEYGRRISELVCPERIFKMLSCVDYLVGMKPAELRAELFNLAGSVSVQDLAKESEEYSAIMPELGNTTDFKARLSSEKRELKSRITAIPVRIDEVMRNLEQEEDWRSLEEQISNCEDELKKTVKSLADISEKEKAITEQRLKKAQAVSDMRMKIKARENALAMDYVNAQSKDRLETANIANAIEANKLSRSQKEQTMAEYQRQLSEVNAKREQLVSEWRAIKARTFIFNPQLAICPTCNRPLEEVDVMAKQSEMQAAFNSLKAEDMSRNETEGRAVKAKKEGLEAKIASIGKSMADLDVEIVRLEEQLTSRKPATDSVSEPSYEQDTEWLDLTRQLKELEGEVETKPTIADNQELLARQQELSMTLDSLRGRLQARERIAKGKERCSQLENELATAHVELAEVERREFLLDKLSKERSRRASEKVNALFKIVRFKLFDHQVNGAEVEVCEPMVDGVPYATLNTAARINAGIDILNAFQKGMGISVPIIIDNAEAVNDFIETEAQSFRLIVTETDKTLVIKSI